MPDRKPLSNLENRVAEALSKLKRASAGEIARELYPDNTKQNIPKVSVILKRLEKKGIAVRSEKKGRSVPYSLDKESFKEQISDSITHGLAWLEKPFQDATVEKEERVAVTRKKVGEKIRRVEAKETIVKLREIKVTEEPQLSQKHTILKEIEYAVEGSASDIAKRLWGVVNKNNVSAVSVHLKRLEMEGKLQSKKEGRRRLYKLKGEVEEQTGKGLRRLEGLEGEVYSTLKQVRKASASDIADRIYETATRADASKVYVTLQRLAEKGLLHELEKEGRKTYFAVERERRLRLPELPKLPHVPPMYAATGLSLAIVAIIAFSYTGGLGLFAGPTNILILSLEQRQIDGLQGFVYGVSNINTHPVSSVRAEAILPEGSELTDTGGAQVSQRDGLTVLTWLLAQIRPSEKQMFSFSGNVPGQINLYASGLSEQEKQQNILDRPVQAQLPAGEYGYKQIDIEPVGYLGEIAVSLSAGPEGTKFTEETVIIPEIPLVNITENVTVIPILPPIITPPVPENVTPPVQPPAENVTPPVQPPTPLPPENVTPPAPPVENITPVVPPIENITPTPPTPQPPVTPPVENVTPPAPTPQPPVQPPTENVTPPVPTPLPPEDRKSVV